MTSAKDVANFYIDLVNCDEYGDGMTNMRLNKFLFFAQGHYFARTGEPLFDDEFEAWDFGPVISNIYQRYKSNGRSPITEIDSDYNSDSFTEDQLEVLLDVAREYGKYATSTLVSFTHRDDSPWVMNVNSISQRIPKNQIKDYFSSQNSLRTFDDVLLSANIPVYDKRDADGYLILPKDNS